MIPKQLRLALDEIEARLFNDEETGAATRTLQALGIQHNTQLWEVYSRYLPGTIYPNLVFDEVRAELEDPFSFAAGGEPFEEDPWESPIGNSTAFVRATWEVPDDFVCISSIEGEGAYLYRIGSEAIYDFDLGQSEPLAAGEITPRWPNFFAFLNWYLVGDSAAK